MRRRRSASADHLRRRAAVGLRCKDQIKMSDRPSQNLNGLDIEIVRRIEEVCRRFETDWRQGRRPRIEDYLSGVSELGRPALRVELEALERELRPLDKETAPEAGPPTVPEPRPARILPRLPMRRPSTLARNSRSPSRSSRPRWSTKRLPFRQATRLDLAAIGPRSHRSGKSHRPPPAHRNPPASDTSATTRSSARSLAAGWALCSSPARSA